MKRALDYEHVALVPRYSNLNSRKEANVTNTLGTNTFRLPVIPSNMRCVINSEKAKWLSEKGYMYVMHRFDVSNYDFVKTANQEKWKVISVSVGVKEDDYDFISCVHADELRLDYITVDIAHGDSQLMKNMLHFIKQKLPNTFVIAGNVATPDGYDALAEWGANAIKVGIGPGAACTTKLKTGFTYPMYSCIQEIARNSLHWQNTYLIADGGIKHNGDIAKAIHAGADWVMCGKMFSECIDSPAPSDNRGHKMYFGSASSHNKHHDNNIEGTLIAVETNSMTYEQKLKEIEQDLQSAVSYAGGHHLGHIMSVDCVEIV